MLNLLPSILSAFFFAAAGQYIATAVSQQTRAPDLPNQSRVGDLQHKTRIFDLSNRSRVGDLHDQTRASDLQQQTRAPEPPFSEVPTINLQQFQDKTINNLSDTLVVVNFWATWCVPCVREIPYFEKAGADFAKSPVKVMLVSLDFNSEKDKVNTFVQQRQLKNDVFLLNAGNPDNWINAIHPDWSGAIPATAFYQNGKKLLFVEGELNQKQLDSIIGSHVGPSITRSNRSPDQVFTRAGQSPDQVNRSFNVNSSIKIDKL